MLDGQQTIAHLVLDHPECAAVLQRHQIDFCRQGKQALAEAARAGNLGISALVEELDRAIVTRRGELAVTPHEMPTPQLIAFIVAQHHAYLRTTLPFLRTLAARVARVHGERNPRLQELKVAVEELASSLLTHLDEEERSIFPKLLDPDSDRSGLAGELRSMMGEPLAVAVLLGQIRATSEGFVVPEWACGGYRALLAELRQLESDLFTHMHLEARVLLPRFAAG